MLGLPGVQISQGDSLGLKYGLKDVVFDANWRCKVVVKASLDEASPLEQMNLTQRNAENTRFLGKFTRDTTQDWPPGDYLLIADVYNDTLGEGKELHATLRVLQQGVDT